MNHLRLFFLCLVSLIGCNRTPTGNLKISIAGLPSGVNADINLSGPSGYSKKLTSPTTLSGLTVGNYTLSVGDVLAGSVPYMGLPSSATVQVSANATASAQVEYFPKVVDESSNNNAKSTAQSLRYGMTANAVIETPGDQDWYRFVAQAGDFIKVDVDARTLGGAWGSGDSANAVTLELHDDTSSSYLALSDATSTIATLSAQYNPPGDPIITYLLTSAGTYYLRATSRFANVGTSNHKYALKLSKTTVPWSSQTMRIAAGHLKNYEKGPDGIPGVSILGNAVVDIFEGGDDFNPTGRFSYSVSGPAGWNGGNPYNGQVDFFGHQAAIAFLKDSDVSPTAFGEVEALSKRGFNFAYVEPLQVGTYTLSIQVHGQTLTKSFVLNSADALPLPQNVSVTPTAGSSSKLTVSWSAVAGAKKYVVFVYRPDGSVEANAVVAPTTTHTIDLFVPLQTGGKYNVQVFAHDFNFLADTLGGKYNKSGHLATEYVHGLTP